MDANRNITTAGIAVQTETERVAARLLLALDAITLDSPARGRDAERHATRLRFALDHLDDLRREAAINRARASGIGANNAPTPRATGATYTGNVFVPARVEVAASILETHVLGAARVLGIARRTRATTDDNSTLDDIASALTERAA